MASLPLGLLGRGPSGRRKQGLDGVGEMQGVLEEEEFLGE